jgi:signal peptidase I
MGGSTRNGTGQDAKSRSASRRRVVLDYVILAVVAIAMALLIQAFLVKPYRIPSESMENTLLIGDRVLVDRISWRFSEPERADIAVFQPPVAAHSRWRPPLGAGLTARSVGRLVAVVVERLAADLAVADLQHGHAVAARSSREGSPDDGRPAAAEGIAKVREGHAGSKTRGRPGTLERPMPSTLTTRAQA